MDIKNINIYSPINGIVTGLYIRKGEKVVGTSQMMGTELMRIADMSQMKVDVNVNENEIQKMPPARNDGVRTYLNRTSEEN